MTPDGYAVNHLSVFIASGMGPRRLGVQQTHKAIVPRRLNLVFENTTMFICGNFLPGMTKMCHIGMRVHGPWWTGLLWRLRRRELQADETGIGG